jgi:membrane fusion protein (multidrug efflux system)
VARDTARRLLEDATIRAPIDGSVDDLLVNVGDYLAPGAPVARVLDLSRARVFGGVTAEEAARLSSGMPAKATFASLGGLTQQAELRSVARAADPADGTYRIELWIDEPDARLRDGVVATLAFDGGSGVARPLAPRVALVRSGGHSEVFVVKREAGGDGVAHKRAVRTGRSGGERIEILEGLVAGDEVVIDGQFALHDGSKVTIDGVAPASDVSAN